MTNANVRRIDSITTSEAEAAEGVLKQALGSETGGDSEPDECDIADMGSGTAVADNPRSSGTDSRICHG